MKDIIKIKCNKCGFMNIKGSKKCAKCKTSLEERKSCPKCAKKNSVDVKNCVNCGYDFYGKKRTFWFNLVISIMLIIVLALMVYFEHRGIVSNISNFLKILAVILIFFMCYKTVNYGGKEVNKFSAEEEFVDDKRFDVLRNISNVAIVVGTIMVVIFLIYYYFIR